MSRREEEPDLERMTAYRYARLQAQIVEGECTGALLCGPKNIRYATGTGYAQVANMHAPTRAIFVPAEGKVVFYDWEMYNFGERPAADQGEPPARHHRAGTLGPPCL